MARRKRPFYCNFEDTRLFGLSEEDFPAFIELVDEIAPGRTAVFLDEVQEVSGWQRLVRAFLDRGRLISVTGSNASLLGRELGSKLTGRHRSFEVLPFSYTEYLRFTRKDKNRESALAYLDEGGFPSFLYQRYLRSRCFCTIRAETRSSSRHSAASRANSSGNSRPRPAACGRTL